MKIWLPGVLVVSILLGALGHWPYAYYQFTRLAVPGVGVWFIVQAVDRRRWVIFPVAAAALVFNPIAPLYLQRETWQVLDVAAAAVFAVATVVLARSDKPDETPGK